MKFQKAIIIGAAGFIGSSLARYLTNNHHELILLDTEKRIFNSNFNARGIKTISMDFPKIDKQLLDEILPNCTVLIHLACTTNPAKSMANICYDVESNIIPSIEIFTQAVRHEIPKIIFASSGGTVYGESNNLLLKECDPKRPISAYGISKFTIEKYLSLICKGTNTCGVSLRIGNPYGEYQLNGTTIGAIAAFLNATYHKKPITIWGDGNNIRDYIYIEDLLSAINQSINNKINSGSYNIGSGVGHSVNQILKTIEAVAGYHTKINYEECRSFDVSSTVLDTNKFKKATNWNCQYSLKQGIENMWETLSNRVI